MAAYKPGLIHLEAYPKNYIYRGLLGISEIFCINRERAASVLNLKERVVIS